MAGWTYARASRLPFSFVLLISASTLAPFLMCALLSRSPPPPSLPLLPSLLPPLVDVLLADGNRTPNWNLSCPGHHWLVRQQPPMTQEQADMSDLLHVARWQALLSVDDLVEDLVHFVEGTPSWAGNTFYLLCVRCLLCRVCLTLILVYKHVTCSSHW